MDLWRGKGKIRHKRIVKYEDGGESSSIVTENEWVTTEGGRLLDETRQVTVLLLEGREWLMVIDMELKAHEHWHIDISYLNICGTFYYLCSILDGFSRYIVHWEIRGSMTEADVEIILQRAREAGKAKRKAS